MGSTGDPNRLSPARCAAGRWRPRAGEEGGARALRPRSRTSARLCRICATRSTGHCSGQRCCRRVTPTPRSRGAGLLAAVYLLRKRPQRRTTSCRTCGDCWWPVRAGRASPSPGRQQAAPGGGGAACCTGTPHEAPRPEGLAVTLALRRLPVSQREAIVLTSCPDLSPDLAAAGMRVSLATLRRRLAEARSALRAVLPSNL